MAGDGTSFQIDIGANANGVDAAARSVDLLSQKLEDAGKASTAAADAVKVGEASYKAAESAADKAAKALERVTQATENQAAKAAKAASDFGVFSDQYAKASAKLGELTARQNEAAAAASSAKTALASEAAALDKLKQSASGAKQAELDLGKAHGKAVDTAKAADKVAKAAAGSGKVNEMGEAFGKLGGPLGKVGQQIFGAAEGFKKMGASLGSAGPYVAIAVAIVAIGTAVAAAAVAFTIATAKIAIWAVTLADAARTQKLLSDGIAGSVDAGNDLNDQLDRLQNTVPLSRDELVGLAKDAKKAGLEGKELRDKIQETAVEAAKAKFGPSWEKQMLSIGSQTDRLKRNFSGLFGSLRIEKLLSALSDVVALFDKTNVTGRAIQVVFESLFQPLIDGVVEWVPKMIGAFIQFEILVMKALIAIKPFGSTIVKVAEFFGFLALALGGVLAAAVAAITLSLGALAFAISLVAGAAVAVIAGITYLNQVFLDVGVSIVSGIANAFNTVVGFFTNFGTTSQGLGGNIVEGLAAGILGAGPSVVKAISGVVGGAISTAKGLLGIASPSKVFAEIGGYTAEGMAGGVEEGTGEVQGSLTQMVTPPEAAALPSAAAPGAASGGGGHVFQITITAGGGDANSIADAVVEAIEGLMAQAGRATANA